ncbi:MAG: cupin domain-containing protein [bacterium]|jgi:quercetin dioxygenase-like cupin family protein
MLIQGHKDHLKEFPIPEEHARNTIRKVVFSPERGWDSHVMRIFTMGEKGRTYEHTHPWQHYVFILAGTGKVVVADTEYLVEYGHYLFIPGNTPHYLENTGKEPFEFICIVPKEGDTLK